MKVKKNIGYVSVALSLMWSGIYANAAEQYLLDTSVVSASGFAQDVKDAPASISVITKEELESRPVQDIADAIKDVPGVDVSMTKLGTYQFNIRGYGSNYVLVLVDGKRQNSVRGFQNNGFGEADMAYLPPISMIERIEVIKGPASTLYGGDAVGGVINIITKKNPSDFSGSISFDTKMQQHYNLYGHSRGVNGYLAIPLIKDELSLALRGQYRSRDASNLKWPSQTNPSNPNTIYPSHSPGEFSLGNIGGRLNWTINEQNNVYLDLNYYDQKTATRNTSGNSFAVNKRYNRTGIVLNHDGYYNWGTLNTYVQSNTTKEDGSTIVNYSTGTPVSSNGAKLESQVYVLESKAVIPFNLQSFGSATLSAGAQYMYENFITFADSAGILKGKDQDQSTISPYGEVEYYITDDLILTGGLRYTESDLFDGEFIPRGYLVYHLTDSITLKGGVAKGYKTPEAKALHNGEYSTGAYGNPDLEPETSTNYEIGAIFDFQSYGNFTITGFMTDFKNELSSDSYDDGALMPNGIICNNGGGGCSFDINRGENQARGIEFAAQSGEWKGLSLNASYTYMEKEYKGADINVFGGKRVENLPRHTAMVKLNYTYGKFTSYLKATGRFDTLAKSKGGGNRPIPGLDKYDEFYIFDLGFNYKMTQNSNLSFVINNLLDKDFFEPYRYEGSKGTSYANRFQDYTEGRNFWINYKLDF